MKAFRIETGTTASMMEDNINTDQILPSRFLSRIEKTGFGQFLFANWRYIQEPGPHYLEENPNFVLNQPQRRQAKFLITGDNFAGGSSREHAVWALDDWGIRAVIAGSFSDIFYNNSFKNGLLALTLPLEDRMELSELTGDTEITINLEEEFIHTPHKDYSFQIDPQVRHKLLNGIDDIMETMAYEKAIQAYEEKWNNFYQTKSDSNTFTKEEIWTPIPDSLIGYKP